MWGVGFTAANSSSVSGAAMEAPTPAPAAEGPGFLDGVVGIVSVGCA